MSEAASVPEGWGPPEQYRIPRDEDRDLAFTGWRIGTATQPTKCWGTFTGDGQEVAAGIDVNVYATEGGRIVTHSYRWTEYAREREGDDVFNGGFTGERHRNGTHSATWHASVDEALAWLREDAGGRLGESSKAAWTEACRKWPALSPHEVEAVDSVAAGGALSIGR